MTVREITPAPISADAFAPYGELIYASDASRASMNDARFDRYRDLANIDVADGGGQVSISIARCRKPSEFPYTIGMLECHPHGSQAFIPLTPFAFIVVVAPSGENVDENRITAFVTDGTQGINYRKGVWHMPMIATQQGQQFLIIDRAPSADNLREVKLDSPLSLLEPPHNG
ncbi:MAG: ureidoglycolate lyase [Woeseiaceae bacterium]|nr:ureidoglycolate lyase [Woeseiaceae bacterium]